MNFRRGVQWACVAWAVVAGGARGADWPQWRGPQRDGVANGLRPPQHWTGELEQAWRVEVGLGHSSPVVVGNRVYVLTRQEESEFVRCLALDDGQELWRHHYAAPYEVNPAAAGHGAGPKSTPVVAGDRLVTLGISGILTCWNTAKGKRLWQRKFDKQFEHTSPLYGTATSPLVDGEQVLVHVGGDKGGALSAFALDDGEVAWSYSDDGPAYSSPIVAQIGGRKQVIAQTETLCVGLDRADGTLLWKIPFETEYVQNAVTPVVYEESVIFSGLNKGVARYRIDYVDDEWRTDESWLNREVSLYMSSPVAAGQRLFGFSHKQKGQLFALDLTTGETLWTGPGRLADNVALVRTGTVLWALTSGGELIAFGDGEQEYTELARYRVADGPTWAHPVMLPGGVLVKDAEHLTMWRWPPNGGKTARP